MGWTHSPSWKGPVQLALFLQGSMKAKASALMLEDKQYVLWMICTLENGEDFISAALLDGSEHGWGCKVMDEVMHPFYYSCPLEFLERTDSSPHKDESWRLKVIRNHGAGLAGVQVGLPNGQPGPEPQLWG